MAYFVYFALPVILLVIGFPIFLILLVTSIVAVLTVADVPTEAIQTYSTALQLAPTYADAHYNLALAYEKIKEPRKALKHWCAYAKLDTTGPWAMHARSQVQRILQADGLKLVWRGKQDKQD